MPWLVKELESSTSSLPGTAHRLPLPRLSQRSLPGAQWGRTHPRPRSGGQQQDGDEEQLHLCLQEKPGVRAREATTAAQSGGSRSVGGWDGPPTETGSAGGTTVLSRQVLQLTQEGKKAWSAAGRSPGRTCCGIPEEGENG